MGFDHLLHVPRLLLATSSTRSRHSDSEYTVGSKFLTNEFRSAGIGWPCPRYLSSKQKVSIKPPTMSSAETAAHRPQHPRRTLYRRFGETPAQAGLLHPR